MYTVANGITLCKKDHDAITGKEEKWEYILFMIINRKIFSKIDIDELIKNVK